MLNKAVSLLLTVFFSLSAVAAFPQGEALVERARQLEQLLDKEQYTTLTGLEQSVEVKFSEGRVTVYGYKIWLYPTTASVQEDAYETLYVNELRENLTVLTAASISPTGEVRYADASHQKLIDNDSYNTFTESAKLIVSYPAVTVGGMTVIAFKREQTLTPDHNFWNYRSYPQQHADMLNYSFRADWTSAAPLYFNNSSPFVTCAQQSTSVECHASNLQAAESDSVVNWGDVLGQLSLSTEPDWEAVKAQVRPGFVTAIEAGDTIEPLIAAFKEKADGKQDLIRHIFEFVARDIRYVSRSEAGYDIVPHDVNETLENRFGDCKDKSALLTAMLRAIDIDAQPVLVATERQQVGMAGIPSVGLFDHVVVCFSDDGERYCLDPTDAYTQWQTTSDWIQGRLALNLSNNEPLTTLPHSQYRWQLNVTSELFFSDEGGQQESQTLTYKKEYASLMRSRLAGLSHAKQVEYMEDLYHEVINDSAEPVYTLSGVDSMSDTLTAHSETEYDSYFDPKEEIDLVETGSWMRDELSDLWVNNKVYGIYVSGGYVRSEHIIHTPHAWALNRYPPDLSLSHRYGQMKRTHEFEPGDDTDTLKVVTEVWIPAVYLNVEDIEQFNDLLNVFYRQSTLEFGHN